MIKDYEINNYSDELASVTNDIVLETFEDVNARVIEDFKDKGVITQTAFDNKIKLAKSVLTNNIAKPVGDFVSDLSDSLIKLKPSQFINTIKNKVASYTQPSSLIINCYTIGNCRVT